MHYTRARFDCREVMLFRGCYYLRETCVGADPLLIFNICMKVLSMTGTWTVKNSTVLTCYTGPRYSGYWRSHHVTLTFSTHTLLRASAKNISLLLCLSLLLSYGQDKKTRKQESELFRHTNSQTLCHHPTFNQALGIASDFRQIDMVHQKDMANIKYRFHGSRTIASRCFWLQAMRHLVLQAQLDLASKIIFGWVGLREMGY